MTRYLLLDVDGVLMTPPDWFGIKIRREVPEVASTFFSGPFLAATRGEIDLVEHLSPVLEALGRTCEPAHFLEEWHAYETHPNLPMWEAVRQVRSRFAGVYLATNQERHRTRHLLNQGGLASLVDGEFASCTVGHRKPTAEYYAEVTRRLGVTPAQILFVDDAEENVIAAREAGWDAHHFQDVAGFLAIL